MGWIKLYITVEFGITLEWHFTGFWFYIATWFEWLFKRWTSIEITSIKRDWPVYELYTNERDASYRIVLAQTQTHRVTNKHTVDKVSDIPNGNAFVVLFEADSSFGNSVGTIWCTGGYIDISEGLQICFSSSLLFFQYIRR